MRALTGALAAGLFSLLLAGTAASQAAFDPKPWVEDLRQAQTAMSANYANLEWAVRDRGVDLAGAYPRLETALGKAKTEAEARRLVERFLTSFGDGHLRIEWPAQAAPAAASATPAAATTPAASRPVCPALGFSEWGPDRQAVGQRLSGYTALDTPDATVFPAGVIRRDGRTLGVLRIGLFSPEWRPDLCQETLTALNIPADGPCDEACGRQVKEAVNDRYTAALRRQIAALQAAGSQALLVDIASNGGGTEWVNIAAAALSPKPLGSPRLGLTRHPDFARMLKDQAAELRTAAAAAAGSERAYLTTHAARAEKVAAQAAQPCDRAPLWRGETIACSGLATGGLWVSGFSDQPVPPQWRARSWASTVSKLGEAQPLWRGPLILLVDGNTASASEQLVSQVQAAKAGVVVGSPTHGSGCGYISGSHGEAGYKTVLKNSGATLFMPNCARFRSDGINEVGGLEPDVLLPFRPNDTAHQKARRLEAALPRVLAALER
jgi:hypothetical protein